jgi:hypothetical protein
LAGTVAPQSFGLNVIERVDVSTRLRKLCARKGLAASNSVCRVIAGKRATVR